MNFISAFIYSDRLPVRLLRHIIFWVVDIANYLVVVSLNTPLTPTVVYGILFRMPLVILATYFILYYLLPKLSTKDDRGQFFLWMLVLLFMLAIGIRYYKYYILGPWFDPQHIDSNIWDGRRIISEIFSSVIVISMALAIKLIKNKTELQQRNEQLVHEKKESELIFLKAQMHPHFLFNTLNTLYSETIQESGKAQSIVLHLSSLLRFILEECDRPYILLEHEIKVIRDFIALEQLRHGERLSVDLVVSDVPPELEISPLIFLPFVENSFKHTLNHKRGRVSIRIEIVVIDQQCRLLVWNEREAVPKHVNGRIHGRGLANIKRQLELLYGKDYSLVIDDTKNKYEVSLTVPLKQSA